MRAATPAQLILIALKNLPLVLLIVLFGVFSLLDPRFFTPETMLLIASQTSYVGILAIGMTFVLVTAGIDLSVGAIAYLVAVLMAELLGGLGLPVIGIVLVMAGIGLAVGAVNGALASLTRISPFIITLAAMGVYRGQALGRSQSREVSYPQELIELGNARVLGVPLPIVIFLVTAIVAHVVLTRTTFGRQLYAIGQDQEAAARAGIRVRRLVFAVYAISGALAGLGAFVAVIQLGTVIPSFGLEDEFDAIAAAIIGGASLFGGRGSIFPGTVAGAILVQMISVGLVFMQVDLYLTPIISAIVIFIAVLLDTMRTRQLEKIARRAIRLERDTNVPAGTTP